MSLSSMSRLAFVTRRLGQMSLQQQSVTVTTAGSSFCRQTAAYVVHRPPVFGHTGSLMLQMRCFASKSKKSKVTEKVAYNPEDEAATQHKEWVKFQQSIAVDGFDTGATTEIQRVKKGGGRGKRKTKRDEQYQRILDRERLTEVSGGEFPPERYSDEETARLLEQAYNAVPPRAGKRGTRSLKRQKLRWHLVRGVRKRYKAHMAKFQIRKMAERSRKAKDVNSIIREAKSVRLRDREYQLYVLNRWNDTMAKAAADKGSKQFEEAELA